MSTEFVRSVFDGRRDMDTLCPPVRSSFLHARHMPRWREEDENRLFYLISNLLAFCFATEELMQDEGIECSQTRLKLDN